MRHAAWLLLVLLPMPAVAHAQETLVLSGGGSRGLAHIGALVALDSLHRDPDLVVGVSMGAIVGSLYAAGYSGREIRAIATGLDWSNLFQPQPLVIGPQRDVRLASLHWGVVLGRFEFSRGFMPDLRANRKLVHLLFEADARARGNFDRLPRRYRALAVDNRSGEAVVLGRGDLARAVRASMAEPGFFSPVQWNERVLIDGGIADYLPVGLAKDLGGSPVIAVDVLRSETPVGKDPVSVLRHAITLLILHARADTTPPDYLVVPNIDPAQAGFSYPDDVQPLVQRGLAAALRIVPPGAANPTNVRNPAPAPDSLARLVVETPDSSLAALVRAVFRDVAPARYSTERVLRAVDHMYASGFTESVWPRVDSTSALIVHVDPRANGTLDIAPAYDNDRGGRLWAAIQRRVGDLHAPTEFELAGAVTGTERWGSATLRRVILPLAPLTWTGSAYWHETDARFVRTGGSLVTREVTRTGGWLGLERRRIDPDYIFTASFHAEHVQVSDSLAGASFGPLLRFSGSATRRVVGVPAAVELEYRFGNIGYGRAAVRGSLRAARKAVQLAWVLDAEVVDRDAPADVLPALGDDRAMPGMRWGEERGRARVISGFDVAFPILLGGHLRLRARAGAAPLALHDLDDSNQWVVGTELAGVWTLPFASLLVGGGFNTRGRQRFDVVIGQVF